MSELEAARDHLLALAERHAAEHTDVPPWLAARRDRAREHFREQGLPHAKHEDWRYTRLATLAQQRFELPAHGAATVSRDDIEALASPVFACSLHVFVDGVYDPGLSALGAGSDVHVESLAGLLAREPGAWEARLGSLVDAKRHPFAALNGAFAHDGAVLIAPRRTRVEEPLHVVFLSTGGAAAKVRHPRVALVAEPESRVQLIQDFVSLGEDRGLTNAVTEVFVGAGASVDLVTLQREGDGVFHISNLAAQLERDARFSSSVLTLGGRLVRNELSAVLAGEGAEATLNGLFVGAGERIVDNHTLVDHAVPHGTSHELYKGILGGRSRGVFRGRVVVRPDAQKTDAEQSNPNLLLSDGAEVDTRPQLEIYADDVKCSHGSSIGQLDSDALFYLRSRGIAERDARDVLTRGFAHSVLETLPVEALHDGLDQLLDECLAAATRREAP